MLTSELVSMMEELAPPALAEEWDNTGLLVGNPDDDLTGPVMLAIDLTMPVVAEAIEQGCGAVVAYHPPIFKPIRRLTPDAPKGRILLSLIGAGIAVYSPHTALDAVPDGVADWLLDCAAFADPTRPSPDDRLALTPCSTRDSSATHKLVTFVPASHADAVRDALARAGAGHIGEYAHCSFNTPGTGTFIGSDATHPAIGQRGRLESVQETRIEMIVGARALPEAIAALRSAHPYEEPAFDLYALASQPDSSCGPGRCATLQHPTDAQALAHRIKTNLRVPMVKVASADTPIRRIGVCPGSGASLIDAALARNCDAFVTGEMTHHETLAANDAGLSVILAGHTNTERGYLPILASRLRKLAPALEVVISKADASPFQVI